MSENTNRNVNEEKMFYKTWWFWAIMAGKAGRPSRKEAAASAWDATYKSLWREFGCCYYSCRGLLFNAIEEDYIFEIYELAQEIAAAPVILPPDERKINSKEDYHETWFRSNL